MMPTQTITPDIDADADDWILESWQCAVWNAEEVHKILCAGTRGPLTPAQRYRLQDAIASLSSTVETTDLSRLFLPRDEFKRQEALHLKSMGLTPLEEFTD